MTNEILLTKYLEDENFLYETWYKKYMAHNFGIDETIEFKGYLPSLIEIKRIFKQWFEKHKDRLHTLICIKFDYHKNKNNYASYSELILAIAKMINPEYSDSLEILTILSNTSEAILDNLCQN